MPLRKLVRNLRKNAELYEDLERQINILSGMALLAHDSSTLQRVNERLDQLLSDLRTALGVES